MMASVIENPPLNPHGGESTKDFHCFPDLPPELRIRIWQMAYDAVPDTFVYRFRLDFIPFPDLSPSDDDDETPEFQAVVVPLKEVGDLTSELRSLRMVNTECRHEGARLFDDNCLCLNQTEQGGTTDLFPPINLPWKASRNFFCLVGLSEDVMACLEEAGTNLIYQALNTVKLLGFGLDRAFEDGFAASDDNSELAELILLFPKIQHVALVSDQLMSEADLYNINNEIRSSFALSCWDDWVGRVQEDVIGSHSHATEIITREEHLEALEAFVGSMLSYSATNFGSVEMLWGVAYGMILRTKEELGYLLLDDETLEEMLGEDMLSDTFSDEMPSLLSEGGGDD